MNLPNFLIVGAQKSGTTSLHDILDAHPQTLMSTPKEVNFFTYDYKVEKGLEYYSTFFQKKNSTEPIAIGESSPGYICYPDIHKKIHQHLGKIKIVIILRNPIKRAFSQYWDNRRQLKEVLTEEEIIANYLEVDYKPGRKGYFSRGVYYNDVKKYMDLFGRENVHIIIFEQLLKHQKEELHRLYSFLGLDVDKGLQELPKPSNSSYIFDNRLYCYFFNNPKQTKFILKKFRRLLFFGKKVDYTYKLLNTKHLEILKTFYAQWNKKLENLIDLEIPEWK